MMVPMVPRKLMRMPIFSTSRKDRKEEKQFRRILNSVQIATLGMRLRSHMLLAPKSLTLLELRRNLRNIIKRMRRRRKRERWDCSLENLRGLKWREERLMMTFLTSGA
jgi:hypothetical protein